MIQELLATTTVMAAIVFALYSIFKTILPFFKKESAGCRSGDCNCALPKSKKVMDNV